MIAITTTIRTGGGHWMCTIMMMRMIRGGGGSIGGSTWMGIFRHDFF